MFPAQQGKQARLPREIHTVDLDQEQIEDIDIPMLLKSLVTSLGHSILTKANVLTETRDQCRGFLSSYIWENRHKMITFIN